MKCPKCKSSELNKISYNSPYLCMSCDGMWFSKDLIAHFREITIEDIDHNQLSNDHDCKTGMCPSGHGLMIRAKVDIDEPFYLERCSACGGIWFDKGEWQRIAENNLADNLSMIWSRSWQRKQSREKNRDSFLNTNRNLLGDNIFNSIIELAGKLKDHPEKDLAIALLRQEIL
jgi:Zn-finger nucleic acid-binding protein